MRPARALLVAALIAAGCGKGPSLAPPELHLNQDTCHECGMTVSDPRHAAAVIVTHDGTEETFVFDDTGEMLAYRPPAGATIARSYVHDFATGQWLDASAAHFVRSGDLHTPMGSGVVAYASDRAAADAAARVHGRVLRDPPPPAATAAGAAAAGGMTNE